MLYADDIQLDDELRGWFKNSFKERSSVVVNLFVVSISRFIFVLQAEHKHFEPGHSSGEWMEADEKQF